MYVRLVASGMLSRRETFGDEEVRGGEDVPKLTILSLRELSSRKEPLR